MTQQEFEIAKLPSNVENLLDEVNAKLTRNCEHHAYNDLIDYVEYPSWFVGHEGQRLLYLCIQVLKDIP
jgi:hypothetical protein